MLLLSDRDELAARLYRVELLSVRVGEASVVTHGAEAGRADLLRAVAAARTERAGELQADARERALRVGRSVEDGAARLRREGAGDALAEDRASELAGPSEADADP